MKFGIFGYIRVLKFPQKCGTISLYSVLGVIVLLIERLIEAAVEYDRGDPKRIQHFIKVHSFAALIGKSEKLSADEQLVLEAAAVLHDIGIKNAERIHGSASGKYQEIEGVPIAEEMLRKFGCSGDFISEVCYLVGHHHSYAEDISHSLRILMEADFLVNAYEDSMSENAVISVRNKLFRSECATSLLNEMFDLEE